MTWNMQRIIFGAWVWGMSIKVIAKELKLTLEEVEKAIREVAKS